MSCGLYDMPRMILTPIKVRARSIALDSLNFVFLSSLLLPKLSPYCSGALSYTIFEIPNKQQATEVQTGTGSTIRIGAYELQPQKKMFVFYFLFFLALSRLHLFAKRTHYGKDVKPDPHGGASSLAPSPIEHEAVPLGLACSCSRRHRVHCWL